MTVKILTSVPSEYEGESSPALMEYLDKVKKRKYRLTKNAKKAIEIAKEIRRLREELAKSNLVISETKRGLF